MSSFIKPVYLDLPPYTNPYAYLLGLATALGAYGGFPDAPKWFTALIEHKYLGQFFKLLMVFGLVYQGGGTQSFMFSLVITLLFAGTNELIKMAEPSEYKEGTKDVIAYTTLGLVIVGVLGLTAYNYFFDQGIFSASRSF